MLLAKAGILALLLAAGADVRLASATADQQVQSTTQQTYSHNDNPPGMARLMQWSQYPDTSQLTISYPDLGPDISDAQTPQDNVPYVGIPGKGKGGAILPQQDDYYYPYAPPGKGKGKGGEPPPQQDDYYYTGKGVAGKGKGSLLPEHDDYYYTNLPPGNGKGTIGKGLTPSPNEDYYPYYPPGKGGGTSGKGKGAMPPEMDDYYYSYVPPGKGNGGSKGKGGMPPQQDDFYYGIGKGKGGSNVCQMPYPGYGPIPDNMFLDQNGCLHHLPPTPSLPSMKPGTAPPVPTSTPIAVPTQTPIPHPPPSFLTSAPSPSGSVLPFMPSLAPAAVLPTTMAPSPSSTGTGAPSRSSPQTEAPTTFSPLSAPSSFPPGTLVPSSISPVSVSSAPSATSSGTLGPTPAPSAVVSSTNSPTPAVTTERPSGNIVSGPSVNATPFSVTYTLDPVSDPTQANFNSVADLTLAYLQSYFEKFFGNSVFYNLINFSGTQKGNTGKGDPASIGFDVTAVFSDDSQLIPSQSDIDVLINTAFSEPAVNDLIDQLAGLGIDNPFSNTASVEYSTNNVPTAMKSPVEPTNASQVTTLIWGTATVAVFMAICSVAGVIVFRRRRRRQLFQHCMELEDAEVGQKEFDTPESSVNDGDSPSSIGAQTVRSGILDDPGGLDSIVGSGADSIDSRIMFEEATQVE